MDNWQYIVISVILAASVGYAAWRFYRLLKQDNDPCQGCEGCALKDQMRQNCKKTAKCCGM